MIPNNNLSVLPWYTSVEQQNARKWWIYGKVYPLFTPAGFMLPFQIMTPHHSSEAVPMPDVTLEPTNKRNGYYDTNGNFHSIATFLISTYEVNFANVYLTTIPDMASEIQDAVSAIAMDGNGNVTGVLQNPQGDMYTGIWNLPPNTSIIHVVTQKRGEEGYVSTVKYSPINIINSFELFGRNGNLIGDYTNAIKPYLSVKQFPEFNYDVLVFGGQLPVFSSMNNGQYYAKINDGYDNYYSEIFTVVNDIEPYLKITWWDVDDFTMDAGTIVYTNPAFKNVLYLQSDLAKPEYPFEEEGETRDGYFFPAKQISEKRYRFNFLASEYLLDVMRFIRMADFAEIEYHGQRYSLDTFLITPEWEDNGDVASVEAVFDTATVAKKIGLGYIKAQRGDFNFDYNNDYNNQ